MIGNENLSSNSEDFRAFIDEINGTRDTSRLPTGY